MATSVNIAGNTVLLVRAPNRRGRCMLCPKPRPAATHIGMLNGAAVACGCEWHMRLWLLEQVVDGAESAPQPVVVLPADIACAAPGEVCEQPRRSRFRLTPIRNGAANA